MFFLQQAPAVARPNHLPLLSLLQTQREKAFHNHSHPSKVIIIIIVIVIIIIIMGG